MPTIYVAKANVSESGTAEILVFTSQAKTFTEEWRIKKKHEKTDPEGKEETHPTIKDLIRGLDVVTCLMLDQGAPTDDSSIAVRLNTGVDPELAAKIIAETIATYHKWTLSDLVIVTHPEATRWQRHH